MSKKFFWLSLIAVVISFAGGFLLANAINRREIENLTAEVGRLKTAPPAPADETKNSQTTLSDGEIRQKISEADQNPDDTETQKNLALALYRYSNITQQSKWLADVARLLERAVEKNPKDYNALVTLGNIYFDLAQNTKNSAEKSDVSNKNIEQSRKFYGRALAMNPNDSQLQSDLGATFLFAAPPDNKKAIAEFQKSLQTSPRNEKTLELMTKANLNAGKIDDAQKYFDQLKQLNPKNESLPDLQAQFSQTEKK